ncbi:HAD hydrolase-like protein [uncultured Algoriphagus sp.]|uniref:HAD family hydrolase n=1 Tax=uncultured Algoriphagus sp. TaxID=417365 RepID=UPI0030EF6E72|tara:strand:+ start:97274 stop:97918 length:645 start_codon:yes stop_codon:yes gene_type:complete
MKNLESYKVLLWDFDGVIMDSMPIRELGFRKVLEDFPDKEVEKLIHFHRENGGLSRYVKFRYFYGEILKMTIAEEEFNQLTQKFSDIMRELLISSELLIKDSLEYIQANFQKLPMHVVSGSDGEELRYLCSQLGLSKYFKSIHGSPTTKIKLIKELLESEHYNESDVLMIGDSRNDKDAAYTNEIAFAAYNNELLRSTDYLYIDSFRKLLKAIE